MSLEERIAARSPIVIQTMGESGRWFADSRSLPITGIFQWQWLADNLSGIPADRQTATVRILTTDSEDLGLAPGHYMEFRDKQFRVIGLLMQDGGITVVQLAEFVQQ